MAWSLQNEYLTVLRDCVVAEDGLLTCVEEKRGLSKCVELYLGVGMWLPDPLSSLRIVAQSVSLSLKRSTRSTTSFSRVQGIF